MSFNLATTLRESRIAAPQAPCLLIDGSPMSYAEIDDESGRFARGLARQGIERGSVLAIALPNGVEFVVAYFGALKAGVTVLLLNPLLKARELAYLLTDSGAGAVLAHHRFLDEVCDGPETIGGARIFAVCGASAALPAQVRSYRELLIDDSGAAGIGVGEIEPTSPTDTAVLLYTSGTTGAPKGAPLTHFQLYMNCTLSAETIDVCPGDIALGGLSMFHVYGLGLLNAVVRSGAALSVMRRFRADEALRQMERDRVSIVLGVPTMYFELLGADSARFDLSRLRIGASGGAAMPAEIHSRFEQRFGIPIVEGYGLSETAGSATVNRPGDRRFGSVGKPIWGVQLRIVDDQGNPLPPGPDHIGEIVVAGHNVIEQYHHRPDATAAAFTRGWLHTGDLGYRDDDGYVFVVDRMKDLVIRGGYNVYPREVEEVLYAHPAIAEAAVIGVPDARLGEEVHAVVTLRPGTQAEPRQIIEFCRQRVAAYKYPRSIRIIDELPKGPSGKIVKRDLPALFTNRPGAQSTAEEKRWTT
ncbi:long-chain-fatty-acid--CoA ligase [Nocardia gipuzkoensis]|uniref:long-chain-fatty-acid--CoA ligase n=1 Tax=Nocardia gipuzkoensis TaxID=2749991 RepID=UPI0015EF47EF|nr:long-chain fatty acid--CoA ligase [Nocardia gipuzkoensis]